MTETDPQKIRWAAAAAAQDVVRSPYVYPEMELPEYQGVELLENMRVFTETGFLQSVEQLCLSIEKDTSESPDHTHLLAVVGEPVNGKTLFAQEVFQFLFSMREEGLRRDSSNKPEPQLAQFSWGHALDPKLSEPRNYHSDPSLRMSKAAETSAREREMREVLRRYITRPRMDSVVQVAYFDVPLLTGLPLSDEAGAPLFAEDEAIGMPRGYSLLRALINHEEEFSDLPYMTHVVGISSSPEVRKKGLSSRKKQAEATTPEGKIDAVVKSGIIANTIDPTYIVNYVDENASPDQVWHCMRDTDAVIRFLTDAKVIEVTPDERDIALSVNPLFKHYPSVQQIRTRIIGQQIIPFFFHQIGVAEDRGLILHNDVPHPKINAYFEVAPEQPLLDPD